MFDSQTDSHQIFACGDGFATRAACAARGMFGRSQCRAAEYGKLPGSRSLALIAKSAIETSRFSTVVSKLLEDAEAKPLRQTEPGPDAREVEAFSSGEAGLVVFHVL